MRRQRWCIAVGGGLLLAGLCACAGTGTPGSGDAALSNYYYSGLTQQASSLELTAIANKTQGSVQLTQVEFARQLTSDAATSAAVGTATAVGATATSAAATQAMAVTHDAQTAVAGTATQTAVYAQNTAVARETASAKQTQAAAAAAAATATQAQAQLNAQTQEIRIWAPIVIGIILAGVVIVALWQIRGAILGRMRVIRKQGGGELVITEQRPDLEKYLPSFLRWLAWFLEVRQVVMDIDKGMSPVTTLSGGVPAAPLLTDTHDRQERVARRAQVVDVVRALAQGGRDGTTALADAPDEPEQEPPPEDVVNAEYRIVDPEVYRQWLTEVRAHLRSGRGAIAPPGD